MPEVIKEYIGASELSRRTGVTLNKIMKWISLGKIPFVDDPDGKKKSKRYEWPDCGKIVLNLDSSSRYPSRPSSGLKNVSTHPVKLSDQEPIQDQHQSKDYEEREGFNREIDVRNLNIGERIIIELKNRVKGSDGLAYQWGRSLNEVVKSRKQLIELLQMEGKYLPKKEVEDWVYQTSRQNRDMWMNWPQLISQEMAEELGIDGKLMHDILLRHVRKNLERIATLPEQYKPGTDNEVSGGADTPSEDGS